MAIYLDHNASTPVDPRVFDAMLPYFREEFGNPNSVHARGAVARRAIDRARAQVADLVNIDSGWVNFTASATEAVNTAVWSAFMLRSRQGCRVVVTAVEHAAVFEAARGLERFGIDVVTVPVAKSGSLDIDVLRCAMTDNVFLVAVMWANNETGVVFPIRAVADLCSERGVPLLVDAVQAAGRLDIELGALPVTYVALSSHKLYGPKGGGALIGSPRSIVPLVRGGGQEGGRRSGTENVAAVVGFGEAAFLARVEGNERNVATEALRNAFEKQLLNAVVACDVNGAEATRLTNTSSITIQGVDGDALVGMLDALGICISTGSACHSRSVIPSHVILAMTGSHKRATETVRVSFSHLNTAADIDILLRGLKQAVAALRAAR